MKNIFFNASLPRSGGTLLQNVLAQNNAMYVSSASMMLDFISAAKDKFVHMMQYVHPDEASVTKEAFLKFCRVGIPAYRDVFTDKDYYLDKHFAWMHYYSFLEHVFTDEKPKIIVMVRDLRDIVCSFEENYRAEPLKNNMHVNWNELTNTTTQKRVDSWLALSPLGTTLEHIKDVMNFEQDILFIRYEDFCQNPLQEIARVYNYLDIPFCLHDFTNVEQVTRHNDILHFANHDIDRTVKQKQSRAINVLGEDICAQIRHQYDWYFKTFNYE